MPTSTNHEVVNPSTSCRFGIGLRMAFLEDALRQSDLVDWFEILSENFIDMPEAPMRALDQLAERMPIGMHGVSLNIGSADPLDFSYLRRLKALATRVRAVWVSDHLCWNGILGYDSHELLPLPLNETMLKHVAERVRMAADVLERPLILENTVSYVQFADASYQEWEFLAQLSQQAPCQILLDINNVVVNAHNHGFDPKRFIDGVPSESIALYHLAGHSVVGSYKLDSHIGPVPEDVGQLYRYAIQRHGFRPSCLEWDNNIPTFSQVAAESQRMRQYLPSSSPTPSQGRGEVML